MKKVAYLGIPGSFSFIAAKKHFTEKIDLIGGKTIKNVFMDLVNQRADYAVVPVENSTTGSILETYDQLLANNMFICGEMRLKIHHNLLVLDMNTKLKEIKKCYSHPQGISQCESFFEKHSWIKPEFLGDTATAAEILVTSKSNNEAAVAGKQTAKIYGLKILKSNIEDNKNNFTRFLIIGKEKNKSGSKASIAFSVKHVPGSLLMALSPYRDLGLNLTKIESRPIFGKTWEYIFFVDFEIDSSHKNFNELIKQMKEVTEFITVLGLYEKGDIYEA